MRTITAQFNDGTVATRRTAAAYIYASRKGPGMPVRFHTSHDAARRNVSRYSGEIVPTDYAAAAVAAPVKTAEVWAVFDGEGKEVGQYEVTTPPHAIRMAREEGHDAVRASRVRT